MFDVPPDTVLPVRQVDLVFDPAPHPFEQANEAGIDAHWQTAQAANPALFDGKVALLAQLAYRDGRLEGRFHMVRYASFLFWRRHRSLGEAQHIYAHAVPVTRDNALVAIRMGPRTINAGLVYFAAGSFDPLDVHEGRLDVAHNMRREVGEETGIDLDEASAEPGLHALWRPEGMVIFRRYFFGETSASLAERIVSHVGNSAEPEIDGPVIIREPGTLPENLAAHMSKLVEWHFACPRQDGLPGSHRGA